MGKAQWTSQSEPLTYLSEMSMLDVASGDLPSSPVHESSVRLKWNFTREAYLCEQLVEYKRAGKKSGTSWKPEVWKAFRQDFSAKFGVSSTPKQLKAHVQVLKTRFFLLKECICQPGFVWDDERKMVEASDKDWDDYLKKQPAAKCFRNARIPLYNEWVFMFAGQVKSQPGTILPSQSSCGGGEYALHTPTDPSDIHAVKGDIEEAFSNEDLNGESSGCGHSKRRAGKRSSLNKGRKMPRLALETPYAEAIKEVADGCISSSRPSAHVDYNNCMDVVMGMKELSTIEKIQAAELLKDEKDALMFLKFDKECRLAWLKIKLGKS